MATLGGLADQTDETRAEVDTLRNEYRDLEVRSQALAVAADAPTTEPLETRSEDRELARLQQGANVGAIMDAVLEHRAIDGLDRELQQALGLESNQIPLALLNVGAGELETRAVTPAPGEVSQNQNEILPYVFPQSAATFLGVDQPTVPVGEAVYPVLTATLDVHTPAENAAAAETTGAFSADVLSPTRIQASFFYSREDRARFRNMDAALRQNLSDGLADGLDKQIISGTNGLLTGTNLPNHNHTAVTTFANYIKQFVHGRIDGRYASMASDLRVVMGAAGYGHAGEVYRNTTVDRTALDRLMELVSGVRVSAHVPALNSDNRQNQIIRRGNARAMVAPVWEGVTLIPDEITKAANGQIVITAIMLHAVKILRTADFFKQQVQTA